MTFPYCTNQVPTIFSLVISVDDSMQDGCYRVTDNDKNKQDGFVQQTVLFNELENAFMGTYGKLSPVDRIEITSNVDSAYTLRAYIDSWISEAKLMKLRGTWKGL